MALTDEKSPPQLPGWLEPLVPFRRRLIRVRQHFMHVMEQGEGLPVLMLHGNPTWGFLWRRVAGCLANEKLRVIMPDLVGLGFSDHPRDSKVHSLQFHAEQIAALVEQLELERFILVVQDWGGPIGAGAASLLGARIQGLVVLNTDFSAPKADARLPAFNRFANLPLVSELAFRLLLFPARGGLGLAQHDKASVAGVVGRAYRYPLRNRINNGAPLALARMVPSNRSHPSVEWLDRGHAWATSFRKPSAIVWGDSDPVLGRSFKRVSAVLPNAHVTRTQAGHFLQEEVPNEIADSVKSVFAKIQSNSHPGS